MNIFAGLVFDARDGGTLQRVYKGKQGNRLLVSSKSINGVEGSRFTSFPFNTFEAAILSSLREIDPREILPRENDAEDKTLALAGRLVEVESREERIKAKLLDPRLAELDSLVEVLASLGTEKKTIAEELSEARQEAASSRGEAWGECRSLLDALRAAPDAVESRVRLRAALRRIVESIWCLFVARGSLRLAAVQIWFTGGAHRDYFILHRPAQGGSIPSRPAQWWARSLAEVTPGELDLRNRKHAASLERALTKANLTEAE
jgi:hypothetical protein